ncbi:hypothetical protein GN956_G18779 [Arapaima gigas]
MEEQTRCSLFGRRLILQRAPGEAHSTHKRWHVSGPREASLVPRCAGEAGTREKDNLLAKDTLFCCCE